MALLRFLVNHIRIIKSKGGTADMVYSERNNNIITTRKRIFEKEKLSAEIHDRESFFETHNVSIKKDKNGNI